MKQKDVALIIVIAFVSAVLSIILSNLLFGSKSRNLKAEQVDKISSQFIQPDKKYFNADAFDPTRTIRIGDGSNSTPFQ
jgi:ABC-type phosphate/phosphonate transport system permease subunit